MLAYIKPLSILISGGLVLVYAFYKYLNISPLLTLVAGSTILVFTIVATYYHGIDIPEIDYEFLKQKYMVTERAAFRHYLVRAQACLEDKIIHRGEAGKERDRKLEMKLAAVQTMLAKIKRQPNNPFTS